MDYNELIEYHSVTIPNTEVKINVSLIEIILEQRSSKALRKYGNGRITICLDNIPVWQTNNNGKNHGIEWTFSDLLSFLTSNWGWLLNEQGLPLPIKYSPNVFTGTSADICNEIAKKNKIELTKEQRRAIRTFCQRHNLAEMTSGISLPSLFLLRVGNQFLFSTKQKQILINIYDARKVLTHIGDTIYDWMHEYADEKTMPLLRAWKARDEEIRTIIFSKLHLLAKMNKYDFKFLSNEIGQEWDNIWDGSIMMESEIFAAARMSAGFIPINQQIDIINAIKSCPRTEMGKINKLSDCLRSSKSFTSELEDNLIFFQGYDLAFELRNCLKINEISPLDPETILADLGVHIKEMEWDNSHLDAISCWSGDNGPLIILNIADKKRCSHINGRRFTLGHELCHLLVDRDNTLGLVDVLGGGMPRFIERRANAFAAEILLPRQLAAKEFENKNTDNINFLHQLQNKYSVPLKTVASQIFNSSARSTMGSEDFNFYYNKVNSLQNEDDDNS